MKLGAYTACLHDSPLPEALRRPRGLGLTSAEINTGGFLPAPHCPVDDLLARPARGRSTSACSRRPGSNSPPSTATATRSTRSRASARSTPTTCAAPSASPERSGSTTSSRCREGPGRPRREVPVVGRQRLGRRLHGRARLPVVGGGALLEGDRRPRARHGVRVAIELHPQNLVFNAPTMERLVEATGATNVGVEMDPRHLIWQRIDAPRDPPARLPGLLRRRQGHRHLRRPPRPTGSSTTSSSAAGGRPDVPTGRPLVQRLAEDPSWRLRRRRHRPRGRLLGRGAARPERGRPGHHDQHRARGRLDVGARRAVDGSQDAARRDRAALTRASPARSICHDI